MERHVPQAGDKGQRLTARLGAATLLISYPLLFVAALLPGGPSVRLPAAWLFLAVAIVSYLAEAWAARGLPYLVNLLNWMQVQVPLRFAFREIALIILLVRVLPANAAELAVFTAGLLGLHVVRAAYAALVVYVNQHRRMPVVTRNIDLSELRIPDAPPALLIADHARKMLHLDVAPMAGGLAWALTGSFGWALAGVCLSLVTGAAGVVAMAVQARRNAHLGNKPRILAHVNAQLHKHAPEVVLYFAGSRDSVYQLNMWLTTLDRLDRPAAIIMRERWMVPLVGRTSLPVACVEGMVDLVNFPVPSVRVSLFPSNTSKNLHWLRLPHIGHVFVGHGDSDKAASVNPFAKAYDEVWVAGQAGRDRYLRAQVGVRDEDIVEVGRPQLAELRTGTDGPTDRMFTVLYAPTWEGWGENLEHTSLLPMGERIIQALIERAPHIRVLYKPHPLSGTRDGRVKKAHEAVAAVIDRANQQREDSGTWAREASAGAEVRAAALAEMTEIEALLGELTGDGRIVGSVPGRTAGTTDYAMLSRDGKLDPARDAEWSGLNEAWHAAYWRSQGWWRHRVVTGPLPALYDCFNQADLLITDISSVVADFLATGRPYAVTNLAGSDEAEFRAEYPTVAAGYLLGSQCAELPEILAQAGLAGEDRLAPARRELKHYLLGPDSPDAQTRFNDAVSTLIRKVEQTARAAEAPARPVLTLGSAAASGSGGSSGSGGAGEATSVAATTTGSAASTAQAEPAIATEPASRPATGPASRPATAADSAGDHAEERDLAVNPATA
jgi:hypothetical protein